MKKLKQLSWPKGDTDFEKEKKHYEYPIPSRKYLLELIQAFDRPTSFSSIIEHTDIDRRQVSALKARLKSMITDGQLIVNRNKDYCLPESVDLIVGTVVSHKEGYGLLKSEGMADIYISQRDMQSLMHGDKIAVSLTGREQRGLACGRLAEVLKRETVVTTGRFTRESGVSFVVPVNPRLQHDIVIPRGHSARARQDQYVRVRIIDYPSRQHAPVGHVEKVLGSLDESGIESDVVISAFGLRDAFPKNVVQQAKAFGEEVSARDKKQRLDLRETPLVTIDGVDARDFDDAVYAEPAGKGWRLLVAIADVSHYVRRDDELDKEAIQRGTSVYFPRRVIPMLPKTLSNGLCSLNPQVDRLCMVCDMQVSAQGNVTQATFSRAVMRSHARLTYGQVARALYSSDTRAIKNKSLLPHLQHLDGVFRLLQKSRKKRGAVDFDFPQFKFGFSEAGKIDDVFSVERNDAHRLIEECMIAANVEAAKFLKKKKIPILFRRHDPPSGEVVEELRQYLAEFGLALPVVDPMEPHHFEKIRRKIVDTPLQGMVEMKLLRSMTKATYSPEKSAHFGLALKSYAHFTSPIRRYPDLLVHRALKFAIDKEANRFDYDTKAMIQLGELCSLAERKAEEASRAVDDWLKCEFMQGKIGQTFDGKIMHVAQFGLFVAIEPYQIEGLIHISNLGQEYFNFDSATQSLQSRSSNKSFRLGQALKVRVSRVDMAEKHIDFQLDSASSKKPLGKGKRKDSKPKRKGRRR